MGFKACFTSATLVAGALTTAMLPGGVRAQQGPPSVTVATPVVKEIVEDDEFVGRFEAAQAVDVRARAGGYLETVHFEDGALVEAGQLLFTIDQRLYRIALRQAEAQIGITRATFDFAQDQLDRAVRLLDSGNIAQSVVDERRERFLAAQGDMQRAQAQLEEAQINLEYSEVRAPIAGRIDRRLVTPGNLVLADQTVLTTIVSTDPIHFYFDIDERYFLAYQRDARARGAALQRGGGGLEVVVTLSDPREPKRTGVLDFSENRLDPQSGTMRVRAILDNPDGALTPGLFGTVNVPGSLPYEGVLIPDSAVLADQNRRLVMVIDGENRAVQREIRPGPRIDGYRVVREGLDGSEAIVIEGLMRARPGTIVAPDRVALPPVAEDR